MCSQGGLYSTLCFAAAVGYMASPHLRDTGLYSWKLPNSINFSFNFGFMMRFYPLCVALGAAMVYSHMWHQRKKQLSRGKGKAKKQ
eukprot:m.71654 g.71654  ORF g.71654 m.71654 type:complete len:86 (+) comp35755_c0_seq3:1250-1507(+)